MNNKQNSNNMKNLTEFNTFEEAWEAATTTKESFAAFQTGSKIKIMKEYAVRFFVNAKKEFCYISEATDGLRIFKKAEVCSMIHNGGFALITEEADGFLKTDYIGLVTREQAVRMCNLPNSTAIFLH